MPLSIHGHAAHERIMACNHAFSAWSKARDKQRYLKAFVVFHICFSLFIPRRVDVFQGLSFFLLVSTFSKSECWLSLPCQVHLSLMSGRLRQTQLQSLSINVLLTCLILPQSEDIQTCSVVCAWMSLPLLCCCATLQKRRYKVKPHYYSVLISQIKACLRRIKGVGRGFAPPCRWTLKLMQHLIWREDCSKYLLRSLKLTFLTIHTLRICTHKTLRNTRKMRSVQKCSTIQAQKTVKNQVHILQLQNVLSGKNPECFVFCFFLETTYWIFSKPVH